MNSDEVLILTLKIILLFVIFMAGIFIGVSNYEYIMQHIMVMFTW